MQAKKIVTRERRASTKSTSSIKSMLLDILSPGGCKDSSISTIELKSAKEPTELKIGPHFYSFQSLYTLSLILFLNCVQEYELKPTKEKYDNIKL